MSKPVHYFIQNAQTQQICAEYGSYLEYLTFPDALAIRSAIAQLILGRWLIQEDYEPVQALYACGFVSAHGEICVSNITETTTIVLDLVGQMPTDQAEMFMVPLSDRLQAESRRLQSCMAHG